jgi:hypothetical protein
MSEVTLAKVAKVNTADSEEIEHLGIRKSGYRIHVDKTNRGGHSLERPE